MLSDSKVRGLKPEDKRYSLADGEGLIITVYPTGKKSGCCRIGTMGNRIKKLWVNILKLAVGMPGTLHVILKLKYRAKIKCAYLG